MNVLFTVLVTFFAGMGAGLGTGFAGMSAAAVISPMLITFLHMDPYMAVGPIGWYGCCAWCSPCCGHALQRCLPTRLNLRP